MDTLEEQAILEEIVDEVKPPRPAGKGFEGLHYLLFTPFRHPPLRHGTRFGRPTERSLWYGAETVETSLAEKSYYQLLFVTGTTADLTNLSCDWTAYTADIKTDRGVDLTAEDFAEFHSAISSPSSYAAAQQLGTEMRAAGVVAFRFYSARCPKRGRAIGLFEPAFCGPNPGRMQTWRCVVTADGCEVFCLNGPAQVLVFNQAQFERNGALPAPSLS